MLYQFKCPAGHMTEKRQGFQGPGVIYCPCGEAAQRVAVNRVYVITPGPKGIRVSDYYEAASEAKDTYERTDDPQARAATRPDIWQPAWYRSRNKLQEQAIIGAESDCWADPNPGLSEKQVREEVM